MTDEIRPDLLNELVESLLEVAGKFEFSTSAIMQLWATGHLDLSKRWITAKELQRLYDVLDRVDSEILHVEHTDILEEYTPPDPASEPVTTESEVQTETV